MPLQFPTSDVPIVGTPFKVLQHYHTFVVQCQCDAKTVSVIIGDGAGVACPGCGGVPHAKLEGMRVGVGFQRGPSPISN